MRETGGARVDRRAFVVGAALTPFVLKASHASNPSDAASAARAEAPIRSRDEDVLDEALTLLSGTGPVWSGLANHAPMAAESLVELGRPDAVMARVRRYARQLEPAPKARAVIDPQQHESALGQLGRAGDWRELFVRELAEKSWKCVVDAWAPILAPGLSGHACHGVIRAAHAARSLTHRENALRRAELAEGLAYWAATFTRLAIAAGAAPKRVPAREALAQVPTLAPTRPRRDGSIARALVALSALEGFDATYALADDEGDALRFTSAMTRAFAHDFVRQANRSTIAFVHQITGPSAVRLLVPHISAQNALVLARHAWHAGAGIHAAFADPTLAEIEDPPILSQGEIVARAVECADEHGIKAAEACARENDAAADTIYLAAATAAVARLS